ncbi:hypothetical protein [Meiothermus rufus]|uniref:hypothetical protein n=1 Tax=Meiothermus rufus TaxID=604332 RepID=UPI000489862A|nr:hypothetical protein [Meiothermus rufus]
MRWIVALGLMLGALAVAQDLSPRRGCGLPAEGEVCLSALGLLRLEGGGLAAGGLLEGRGRAEEAELRFSLGLWYQGAWQWGLLEAYLEGRLADLTLSLGKRVGLGGPWLDTLMGQDGRWGVFASYPAEAVVLELAYLPHPRLAGGQGYLGFVWAGLRAGGLVEVEAGVRFIPRIGLLGPLGELFWQEDRGFWARGSVPLPLGQALAQLAPAEAGSEWAAWVEALDKSGLEGVLWWNPEWDYLRQGSLPSFWLSPRKLLLGLAYTWDKQVRGGLEVSLAPVEALRVYLELQGR